MILSHLVSFCGCFPRASQNWIVAHNLTSLFEVIFFKFSYGNGVAKHVVSYSKTKAFPLLFTENDDMRSRVRQTLFWCNLQI